MNLPTRFPAIRRAPALAFPLAAAVLATLTACGKGERIPTTAERLASVQQKQETQKDFYIPRKSVDYMNDLKSIKDAPARAEATKAAEAAPKVADALKPAPVPERIVEAAKPAPAPVQAAPQPAVQPPPAATAPASNVVASAAPTARPAPPTQSAVPVVSVVSREQPAFPREALRAGVENGLVRARLTINSAGDVTNVAILQAQPPRVFDRSVQLALSRWKFNSGADNRTFDTEVGFKAAN